MSFSGTKGYITKPKPGVMLNPLHPLSRGLVGYWLFNEGSGSKAYDISGQGNHGRLINMLPNAQSSGWGGSKFGGGLQFDGVNDYVDCGNQESLNFGTGDFTVAAWIRPGAARWSTIVGKYDFNPGFAIITTSNSHIHIQIGDSSGWTQQEGSIDINDDGWHHVVAVFNRNANCSLYIDGKIDFNVDITARSGSINNNYSLQIGRRRDGTNVYIGSIDSISAYNRILLATEVKQLYHDPFCNLLQVPIRRYFDVAPPTGNPYWYYQMLRGRNQQ